MIKVIFFSQNSKFRVRNSHFSHRPKGKIRATGTGFRSDRSQTTKPLALLDLRALSILARISAPRPPIQEPGFSQNRFLSRKHRAFMRCNKFRFRSGKLSRTREKYGPIRAATHLFPDGRTVRSGKASSSGQRSGEPGGLEKPGAIAIFIPPATLAARPGRP